MFELSGYLIKIPTNGALISITFLVVFGFLNLLFLKLLQQGHLLIFKLFSFKSSLFVLLESAAACREVPP